MNEPRLHGPGSKSARSSASGTRLWSSRPGGLHTRRASSTSFETGQRNPARALHDAADARCLHVRIRPAARESRLSGGETSAGRGTSAVNGAAAHGTEALASGPAPATDQPLQLTIRLGRQLEEA